MNPGKCLIKKCQLANIEICRGGVEDAAELAEFAARTFEDTYAAYNDPEDMRAHLSNSFGIRQQSAELADPDVATILVRSDSRLLAYAQARRGAIPPCVTHSSPIELYRFYLDRHAKGTGLAMTLMQEVFQAARDFGGKHVWLSVWERNARAIAFYKKVRFVDVGTQVFMLGPDKQQDRVLVASVDPDDDR